MDYFTALQKANQKKTDLLSKEVILYSNWTTKILEVFLKAYFGERGHDLITHSNAYGSLLIDLEWFLERNTLPSTVPLIIILDEEPFLPGFSLRSDAILTRDRINGSLSEALPLIQQFTSIITRLAADRPIVILPSILPSYPLFTGPSFVESPIAKIRHQLRMELTSLQAASPSQIIILQPELLFKNFSMSQIMDDRLLFSGGWPFSIKATGEMARILAETILFPVDSRKLLITDADQTLWQGIVGDDGVDQISWGQEVDTYRFFIYQKTLNLLMSEGILIALLSKNSVESLEGALVRPDLILNKDGLVCCHASWSPKSEMIDRILAETNLLPSSVVFVDDSEFELGEVRNAFPEVKCIQFPKDNSILRSFLQNLRASFDTRLITAEDKNRTSSMKQSLYFRRESCKNGSIDQYLSSLEMQAKIERIDLTQSERAIQLMNKTNQFNLNGRRFDATTWKTILSSEDIRVYQLHFNDKHSKYGIVSVLLIDKHGCITDWVLSCRVFGRTVEHCMLNFLFEQLPKNEINTLHLHYKDTGKNHVVRHFLNAHASKNSSANGVWKLNHAEPLQTFVSLI